MAEHKTPIPGKQPVGPGSPTRQDSASPLPLQQANNELAGAPLKGSAPMCAFEARLAAIIDSAMDAIITIDSEQRIVVFNASAEKVFGCSAAEAIGEPLEQFIPEAYRAAHRQHVDTFGSGGGTKRSMYDPATLQGMRKDGSIFPFESTISVATVQGSNFYTVILRDVTKRRQTEAALVESEKMASLGRFAATLAHEINNPLEAVLNLLYVTQNDSSISPEIRSQLQLATEEVERVAQIARQTLGFSRGGPHVSSFRPAQALQSVLGLLAPKLRHKQVQCETEFLSSQAVEGIEGEIRQVFWNLLTNAVEAVPQGGTIKVRVMAFPRRQPTGIRITIADNGCGIARERTATLFEPFQTTKPTGNGLGLWVSKQVVKKHHGSICVRSSCGADRSGTLFSIFLPTSFQATEQAELDFGTTEKPMSKACGA